MERISLRVGPKSRVVIPAALRLAAGISEGDELVGYLDSSGRLVLETAASARSRVWGGAPDDSGDSVQQVRAQRIEDVATEESNTQRRSTSAHDGSAGRRLLDELGLA